MKTLSRFFSYGEALLGIVGALLFWLVDATIEKYLIGSTQSYLDILLCPGTHEFRIRLLATGLILLLVFIAALLLRRKEDSEAQMQHSRFLVEEMAIKLGQKNERLQVEIAHRKAIEQRLETLAETDQLTGVYNRRKFDELMNLELRQEPRYHRGLSLAMLDIDHFKEVNDRHGHAVGDAVLQELARLIESTRREADSFFRVGGEEFCLITFASNGANLETACEKIRKAVTEHDFDKAGHLAISIGATQYQDGDDYDSLFKRADAALYKAKRTGRDRVVIV
ncbi:MAG: GGDEF domain-containing protein [Gallionellaceae bacterium]|nr:GGDEF domain-containing protein [Gallionellaceae bacterium]